VADWSEVGDQATGVKFFEYSSRALAKAIRKALAIYAVPRLIRQYRQTSMRADYSWESSISKYLKVYKTIQHYKKATLD
jgi:starch synthase